MKQRISIDQLQLGMFIAGLDQSWFKTPFFRHKWLVKRAEEIQLLRQYGVREVFIDPTKGRSLSASSPLEEPSPSSKTEQIPSPDNPQEPTTEAEQEPNPEDLATATLIRSGAIEAMEALFSNITNGAPVQPDSVRNVVSALLDGLMEHQAAMVSLIQMQRFDQRLAAHGVDTCVLSLVLAKSHGMDIAQLKVLGIGALLHDVGQLRLPLNFIKKRTPYSEQDRKLMQIHPETGVAFLNQLPDIPDEAKRAVLEHHERLDGSGYPRQLQGPSLSLLSQIIAIADTYDAQISGRCSHPPVPPSQAVRELYRAAANGQFDIILIQELIQFLGVYPIGSLVELNTGEHAGVVWVHPQHRLQPTVKLLVSPAGEPYPDQPILNLAHTRSGEPERFITQALDPSKESVDILNFLEGL